MFRTFAFVVFFGLVVAALFRWRTLGWPPLVWLTGSLMIAVIRAPYARTTGDNVITSDRKDLSESVLLAAMFLAMGWLPLIHLATGVFGFADYHLAPVASYVGASLQPPFLLLFWRSHADLGKNWSATLEIREDHSLITDGVYAHMRHPMYAAIWLGVIAQPLLVQNWVAGFLVFPVFLAMYLIRTPREEAMMRDQFGEAYDRYAARTGRILPRFGAPKKEIAR
ncbi:MAG: protein-S-isoprenylcysteine O-methyltransferase [Pseudomonadota bacterium]